jgi:uroporphyrinogen-III decarboxylase
MEKYTRRFSNKETRPFGVWIGGWRGTPELLSPAMFERFSWKYMKDLIRVCLDYGVIPFMHLDANWDLGMHYFRDFVPAGRGVLCLDGKSDIFKAKEIVGDKICLMGDVPATLLAFRKPEEVYAYTSRLCREIGPTGFMCCSGCDIPFHAKWDNIQAFFGALK